jgi:hypothetical protein
MRYLTPQTKKGNDMKKLQEYFESTKGFGVLATADSDGKVDAAMYSRPHFLEEGTLAFIMRDHLTHHNLQSNPSATFLFVEEGTGYKGKRLFLKKAREENNPESGEVVDDEEGMKNMRLLGENMVWFTSVPTFNRLNN